LGYAGLKPDTVLILRSTILASFLHKLERDLAGNTCHDVFGFIIVDSLLKEFQTNYSHTPTLGQFSDRVLQPKINHICTCVEIHEIAYVVDAYVSYGRSDALNGKLIVSYCLIILYL